MIKNFIPTVWSESMLRALDATYIAVAHCNREFEGEILEKGSKVRICGLDPVTVGTYTKNTDLSAPETLSDNYRELVIDEANYFNFQIDDVDRAQSSQHLMEAAVKNAAAALAAAAERHVYNCITDAQNAITVDETTPEKVINAIIDARTFLLKQNVQDTNDIVIEVSPEVAGMILKAKMAIATDNTDALEKGCIGSIGGCKIFVSPYIPFSTDGEKPYSQCVARTKRAIAFAEQLSEIEAYRPERRFADAMKGLHLYGARTLYPGEMVMLNFALPTE